MKTLKEVYSAFNLTSEDVIRLSEEAKSEAIGCGKTGVVKQLDPRTWDLFADISDGIWNSSITNLEKISLGFQLYELFPSYYHFLVPFYDGIVNQEIVDHEEKDIIWEHFMNYLGSEDYHADPVGYVLWVEFFEDGSTVKETWQGLLNYSDRKSLLRLLEQAGPVPFDLKEPVYESLLKDEETHEIIFTSLLYSAYDVFGKIDKEKVTRILEKLKVDKQNENYHLLIEKLK